LRPEISFLDANLAEMYLQYTGEEDRPVFVPSPAALTGIKAELACAKTLATTETIGLFWSRHFLELVDALEYAIEEDQDKPFRYIDRITAKIRNVLAAGRESLEDGELEALSHGLAPAADALGQVAKMASSCSPADAKLVIGSAGLLRNELGVLMDLRGSIFSRQVESVRVVLRQVQSAASTERDVDGFSHRDFGDTVRRAFAYDLDKVLSWYMDDLALCRDEFNAIARRIDSKRSPFEILEMDLGSCSSPDEMFSTTHGYVDAARRRSLDYITLPDNERLLVTTMSPPFKVTCPWGVYTAEGMTSRRLIGRLELNEDNYQAVTKGWLEMMAVHEGYPGHHAHFVKTKSSKLPASFTTGTTAADYLVEGIAHRSERLLEDLFPDRAYRLFVAFRRLHCALRIKAEIDLHLYERPAEETIEEYMSVLNFDRHSAVVQTQAHRVQPGRALSYYTGMRTLEAARTRLGIDERSFTEIIFSYGNVSLNTMVALLEMGSADRSAAKRLETPTPRNLTDC